MLLGRNAIAAGSDRKEKLVPVPEWQEGGEVRLLTLTGDDRVEFEQLSRKQERGELTPTEFALEVAMLSIVDQDGQRLFTTEEHRAILKQKNPMILQRILAGAFSVSRIREEAIESSLGESSGDPMKPSGTGSLSS